MEGSDKTKVKTPQDILRESYNALQSARAEGENGVPEIDQAWKTYKDLIDRNVISNDVTMDQINAAKEAYVAAKEKSGISKSFKSERE